MSRALTVVSVQHYPEFGGPHNEILKLDPYLNARGVRTIALLTDQPGSARSRLEGMADLEVIPLERFRTSLDPRLNGRALIHFKRDIDAIRTVIRRHRADIVKVHGPHNPHGGIAARLEGVPIVWVLSSTRPSPLVRRIGMVYVRRLADSLLVNGRSLARFYPGAESLADRSFCFYPPLDCKRFAPPSPEDRAAVRRDLGLAQDAEVVATIANVTPQKGIEFFVSAAALVREQRPKARFLVVGGISVAHQGYYDRVQQLAASLGLSPDDLRFLGARSDVDRILGTVDVKVIASRAEGTTATAGEAMACGVPVVATDVGAVSEVVLHGKTGLLVPPQDATAIADATVRLLAEPETRCRMGEAGRTSALERFGLDSCADVHVDAYQGAIEWHARRATTRGRSGATEDGCRCNSIKS